MFVVLRDYVNTFFLDIAYLYAMLSALQQRHTVCTEVTENGSPTESKPREELRVPLSALKLWVMLVSVSGLSLLGADYIPLFLELKTIFIYLIILSPPYAQQDLYDRAFGPLLNRIAAFVFSIQSSKLFAKRCTLFFVRRMILLSMALMNYVDRNEALDADAVKDIMSGLVFSKRALDDVDALEKDKNMDKTQRVATPVNADGTPRLADTASDKAKSLLDTFKSVGTFSEEYKRMGSGHTNLNSTGTADSGARGMGTRYMEPLARSASGEAHLGGTTSSDTRQSYLDSELDSSARYNTPMEEQTSVASSYEEEQKHKKKHSPFKNLFKRKTHTS